MNMWFYLFLLSSVILVLALIKIINFKIEVRKVTTRFSQILKTDTNNLITINSTDRDLKNLVIFLNKNLKELRSLELEYKWGNQELKSSITNISHDLRTPLTAIRGYLDLIDRENLSERQNQFLKIIDSRVIDLTALTEQLFEFSIALDDQSDLKKENICLNSILEESLASFYSLFKEYDLTPNIIICSEKIYRLLNKNILKRIFENIISNAIKYSQSDFNVALNSDGTIEFSNKTSLIDSVSLEKMFDRYKTLENAKKSTGIGLSIAKQLTELCGGKISASYENNSLKITLKF